MLDDAFFCGTDEGAEGGQKEDRDGPTRSEPEHAAQRRQQVHYQGAKQPLPGKATIQYLATGMAVATLFALC